MKQLTPKEKIVDSTEQDIVFDYRQRHRTMPKTKTIFCPICNALVKRQNLRTHLMGHNIKELKSIKLKYKR